MQKPKMRIFISTRIIIRIISPNFVFDPEMITISHLQKTTKITNKINKKIEGEKFRLS
jgi:hypothetical protein